MTKRPVGCGSISGQGALFQNTPKTTFDVGKTMSYAGKIMSDIIQTTSDLFLPFASTCETIAYKNLAKRYMCLFYKGLGFAL